MADQTAKLACLLLAAIVVVGMGLSAQQAQGMHAATDCCCEVEPACDADADGPCCPQPAQQEQEQDSEDCPCSCPTCGVMARTVNLFSADTLTLPFFASVTQRLELMPDTRPASAVLGVDIQPPIA